MVASAVRAACGGVRSALYRLGQQVHLIVQLNNGINKTVSRSRLQLRHFSASVAIVLFWAAVGCNSLQKSLNNRTKCWIGNFRSQWTWAPFISCRRIGGTPPWPDTQGRHRAGREGRPEQGRSKERGLKSVVAWSGGGRAEPAPTGGSMPARLQISAGFVLHSRDQPGQWRRNI